MFQHRIRTPLLSIVILMVGVLLFYHPDRKKAVETMLQKGHAAIEEKNLEKLIPLIWLYYRDDLGFSYASLHESFKYIFSQFNDIQVDYRILNITTGKDTCIADLQVWVHGKWAEGMKDLVGKENDPEPVSILCKKDMFKWQVIGSRWPQWKAGLPNFN
jgi:hypothetical protein